MTIIFLSLSSANCYKSLTETCRTFHQIANSQKPAILRHLAHSLYTDEALQFLDTYRSGALSTVQRHNLGRNLFRAQIGTTNFDVASRLPRKANNSQNDLFNTLALEILRYDDHAVDRIVSFLANNLGRIIQRGTPPSWKLEGETSPIPTSVDVTTRQALKKAVYHLLLLLGQFHCTGVDSLDGPRMLTSFELLMMDPSKLVWTYDYTFASQLSTIDLLSVLGLARLFSFKDRLASVDLDTDSLRKWDAPREILGGHNMLFHQEDLSDLSRASIKVFALVNLVDMAGVSERVYDGVIHEVFDSCLNDAWIRPGRWRTNVEIMEKWRCGSEIGSPSSEAGRVNTRVFEERGVLTFGGRDQWEVREILTLRSDGGWHNVNTMEYILIDDHFFEGWMSDDYSESEGEEEDEKGNRSRDYLEEVDCYSPDLL